tara:strand:- start:568 stop:834 length:267 start_codon:yes stop_codon:yes gene_type:complete
MTRQDIVDEILERKLFEGDEVLILADGFEDAVIGVKANKPAKIVYDYWKCLDIVIKRDNAEFDEAIDWLDEFINEDLGQHTPIYLKHL